MKPFRPAIQLVLSNNEGVVLPVLSSLDSCLVRLVARQVLQNIEGKLGQIPPDPLIQRAGKASVEETKSILKMEGLDLG